MPDVGSRKLTQSTPGYERAMQKARRDFRPGHYTNLSDCTLSHDLRNKVNLRRKPYVETYAEEQRQE